MFESLNTDYIKLQIIYMFMPCISTTWWEIGYCFDNCGGQIYGYDLRTTWVFWISYAQNIGTSSAYMWSSSRWYQKNTRNCQYPGAFWRWVWLLIFITLFSYLIKHSFVVCVCVYSLKMCLLFCFLVAKTIPTFDLWYLGSFTGCSLLLLVETAKISSIIWISSIIFMQFPYQSYLPLLPSCFLFLIFTLFSIFVMSRNLPWDLYSWNCNCFAGEESISKNWARG